MNLLTSKRITFPLLITLTVISNTIIFQSESTSESLCVSSSVCVNLTLKIIPEELHPNWECQQQFMEIHTNPWTSELTESERWRCQETTTTIIITAVPGQREREGSRSVSGSRLTQSKGGDVYWSVFIFLHSEFNP